MNNTPRFHELDSLRAIAAIGVVGWHYTNHFGAAPMQYAMAPFYRHGALLVDFFFVLSGFVLARAYWSHGRNTAFISNIWQRIGRLYPLHVATLIAVAGMQYFLVHQLGSAPFIYKYNDTFHFLLNVALLNSSGIEHGFSFNATSWSISTEFIANIIFFAAITLPRKFAASAFLALFSLSATLLVLQKDGTCGATLCHINMDVYRTLVGFIVGIAAFFIYARWLQDRPLKSSEADIATALAITSIAVYLCSRQYSVYSDMAATLFLFPITVITIIQSAAFKRLLNQRPLVYLGTISYSIYLIHYPLQLFMHLMEVQNKIRIPYERGYLLILFIMATVACAALTYATIERPGKHLFNTLRQKTLSQAAEFQQTSQERP